MLDRAYWYPWSFLTFQRAGLFGRPVLLVLTVGWNRQAQRMDAETLSDPEVARAINDGYVAIRVDADRCTMCLACVGSCPEGAILDNAERPQLRFIETKCVQCGICASTCPEHAIALVPQLDLTPDARAPRVLNEAEVVGCTTCGKPLGTRKMIDGMLARLAQHSMFAAPGSLDRLRMCADCRVKAMVTEEPGGIDLLKGGRI